MPPSPAILCRDAPDTYHFVVSEPLGRKSYKEQYLYVFRPDRVSVLDSYQYDDGCEPCGNDTFSREPAIVRFSSPFTKVRDFAIVPLHAAPTEAVAEIDALYDVYLDVRKKWGLEDIMLMGDFNAGCSYVTPSQWSSIRLRTNPTFQWLISDTADTTVTSTHCAYDRVVVAGSLLQSAVVLDSAAPFDFQAAYELTDQLVSVPSSHFSSAGDTESPGGFLLLLLSACLSTDLAFHRNPAGLWGWCGHSWESLEVWFWMQEPDGLGLSLGPVAFPYCTSSPG